MNKTRSRRRLIQFTTKGLLVAVSIVALWLGRTVSRVRNQSEVVATVKEAGGAVFFENDQPRFVEPSGTRAIAAISEQSWRRWPRSAPTQLRIKSSHQKLSQSARDTEINDGA